MIARFQQFIYSVGEGWGAALLRSFIVAALLLIVFALYALRQFTGLHEPAAMEQAQLARNLAAGRGWTTYTIRPADLGALARADRAVPPGAGIPDVRQAPGWPAVLARKDVLVLDLMEAAVFSGHPYLDSFLASQTP